MCSSSTDIESSVLFSDVPVPIDSFTSYLVDVPVPIDSFTFYLVDVPVPIDSFTSYLVDAPVPIDSFTINNRTRLITDNLSSIALAILLVSSTKLS